MLVNGAILKELSFFCDGFVNQPSFKTSKILELRHDFVINFVEKPWNRWESRRLKQATVFYQLERISLIVTNFAGNYDAHSLDLLFERMCIR
jgi:hypothetical protein